MRNKAIIFLIAIEIGILSLGLASASFKYVGGDIKTTYRAGENIKGKIILNLSSENAKNLLTSNFPGNISLWDFLYEGGLEAGSDFSCNTKGCSEEYELGAAVNEISLNKEKIVGLKITGKGISSVDLLKFKIEGGLFDSCEIPLLIDITGRGDKILTSNSYTMSQCSDNNYGCFGNNLGSSEYTEAVIENEICENINLGAGPAFSLGAKIKKVNEKNITMILRDSENNNLGDCDLPKISGAIGTEQEKECIVEYSSAKRNSYWVCISGEFKIKSETKAPVCGTDETDFEIFAKPMGYGKTNIEVNSTSFEILTSEILENYVYDYLKEKYGEEVNCNNPYCIIPIKLTGPAQSISLSNVGLEFSRGSVKYSAPSEFYEVSEKQRLISGNGIEADISSANFVIPLDTKEKQLMIYLGGVLMLRKNISIEKSFDFDIKPKFAYLGMQTMFEVLTNFNISTSKWTFGDGAIEEVEGKKIMHRYTEGKTFNLEVELKRKDGIVAIKTFSILVGNPKESVEAIIKDYNSRLGNITKQTEGFPPWVGKEVKAAINLSELESSLKEFEEASKSASSDEDYTEIMEGLLALNFPSSISIWKKGKLPLAIGFENIDSGYYKEMIKEEKFSSDELKKLIMGWFNKNYKCDVDFEEIAIFREDKAENLGVKFKLGISANEGAEQGYLFIDYPFEEINFKENYEQKSIAEGAAAYIPLKAQSQSIEFFIENDLSVAELAAYISPTRAFAISEKEMCEEDDPECQVPFPWGKLALWIGIALFVVLIIYIVLQEWYKRKYEYHLFKNTHDLYNLVNFIYNSRVNGLTDTEIKKKLQGAGWKGEKITYAFKKIDGKRTGMWEIPLFKSFENRRVKEEIVKRQGGQPIDTRFIKRPAF